MSQTTLTPEACAELIRESSCTVAFTGAGISTAAGIPDFRGPEGIYASGKYDAERTFDIEHFRRDPREFFRFTRDLLSLRDRLTPTFTHRWLAELEQRRLLDAVITQNIDPLHRLAGSRNVIAVHGDYGRAHCMTCGREFDFGQFIGRLERQDVPRCDCEAGGVIKPDVVFFGEPVHELDRAAELAVACDLMLVLGSTLTVYPAAHLPQLCGGTLVVISRGPVSLPRGPRRHFVEADLDGYTREVAAVLGIRA